MVIYKITSPSDKFYIGKTINLEGRLKKHFSIYSRCPKLKNAINKYGKESFRIDILKVCFTIKELNESEIFFIDSLKPQYNITNGGDGGSTRIGMKHTKETKEKISQSMLINNPMKGKTTSNHQKETARKLLKNKNPNKTSYLWSHHREDMMKRADKIRSTLSKKVIDLNTGIIYSSPKSLSDDIGYSLSYLYKILGGKNSSKLNIRYY